MDTNGFRTTDIKDAQQFIGTLSERIIELEDENKELKLRLEPFLDAQRRRSEAMKRTHQKMGREWVIKNATKASHSRSKAD